ncbi:hypothetical protein C8J57DRAFT_1230536 [Mycena rebaudengoi]|nr:hypothetical protein C8J57DRAFT_1230536 [Mycena rebaudengoi]
MSGRPRAGRKIGCDCEYAAGLCAIATAAASEDRQHATRVAASAKDSDKAKVTIRRTAHARRDGARTKVQGWRVSAYAVEAARRSGGVMAGVTYLGLRPEVERATAWGSPGVSHDAEGTVHAEEECHKVEYEIISVQSKGGCCRRSSVRTEGALTRVKQKRRAKKAGEIHIPSASRSGERKEFNVHSTWELLGEERKLAGRRACGYTSRSVRSRERIRRHTTNRNDKVGEMKSTVEGREGCTFWESTPSIVACCDWYLSSNWCIRSDGAASGVCKFGSDTRVELASGSAAQRQLQGFGLSMAVEGRKCSKIEKWIFTGSPFELW